MIDVNIFKCQNCGSRNTYSTKRNIVCRRCGFRRKIITEIQKNMIEGVEVQEEVIKEGEEKD